VSPVSVYENCRRSQVTPAYLSFNLLPRPSAVASVPYLAKRFSNTTQNSAGAVPN
jgi:hypothetical protein